MVLDALSQQSPFEKQFQVFFIPITIFILVWDDYVKMGLLVKEQLIYVQFS